MSNDSKKRGKRFVLAGILAFTIVYGGSWLAVCGLFKIASLIFHIPYGWDIATGIWAILLIADNLLRE